MGCDMTEFANWSEVAASEANLRGKRLSEIARLALASEGETGLNSGERHAAMLALALGWLDIMEGAKNHYAQAVDSKNE